jgi:tripartite-type tricarboxylate transporter receptor subunit TctC
MNRRRYYLLTLLLIAVQSGCRDAEVYPSRPIMLICPWAAGGGTDRVSRQVAAVLEDELDVPVNVINATGGSGVTGHTRGALAQPDGYTLTMITVELNMLHHRGLTNISYHDFEPLMLLNRDAAAIFVSADAPWQTLEDLSREIRARPKTLKASGTAQGGIWHISVAGWLDSIRLRSDDAIWISINGAAPSLQELLSGGVDFVCCSLPEAATLRDAGSIRCLGVMAPERIESYPEVMTFREQGVDWTMGGWRGLALPNGVPDDRARILLDGISRAVEREEYLDFMRSSGFDARSARPKEFAEALARHDDEFKALLQSAAFESVRHSEYGPMDFPMIIGALLLIVAAFAIWYSRVADKSAQQPQERNILPVALAIVWIIAFVGLMNWLGFIITSFVLVAALMKYLGTRTVVAVAASALIVVATYQAFAVHLRVPLPWGLLGW